MKGKLSQTEKYIIQGMNNDGKSVTEIAAELKRTEACISKYLTGELDRIHTTVAKVQSESKPELVNPPPKGQAKRTMILRTGNDKKGVAVMTSAAAGVGDDFLKAMPKQFSRTARGNMYDADGQKL